MSSAEWTVTADIPSPRRSGGLDHRLSDADILMPVECTDHNRMLVSGRILRVRRWHGNRQIVVLYLVVGDLSYRLGGLPVVGIDGVFGASNRRKCISSLEGQVQLVTVDARVGELDPGRSVVHLEAIADLLAGQGVTGRVGWLV